MQALFVIGGFIAVYAALLAWNGFALSVLWGWFVAPLFNAPTINIPQAIGLVIVASLLAPKRPPEKNASTSDGLAMAFGLPLMALVIGWIVLQIMGG